mmetsp:Transcript_33001/g.98206  ORF Transcript_33001/g.98206 Transcript_33001/m.98206 type:complete len:333 (-) Transcript_33001:287-1285(-)
MCPPKRSSAPPPASFSPPRQLPSPSIMCSTRLAPSAAVAATSPRRATGRVPFPPPPLEDGERRLYTPQILPLRSTPTATEVDAHLSSSERASNRRARDTFPLVPPPVEAEEDNDSMMNTVTTTGQSSAPRGGAASAISPSTTRSSAGLPPLPATPAPPPPPDLLSTAITLGSSVPLTAALNAIAAASRAFPSELRTETSHASLQAYLPGTMHSPRRSAACGHTRRCSAAVNSASSVRRRLLEWDDGEGPSSSTRTSTLPLSEKAGDGRTSSARTEHRTSAPPPGRETREDPWERTRGGSTEEDAPWSSRKAASTTAAVDAPPRADGSSRRDE